MAMPGLAGVDDRAGSDLERGEQRGGAVAEVVVGGLLRQSRTQRQDRGGPLQGLDLAFSSMQSTTAFSGGCKYSPTTSRTFASSSGSVENVNVSTRQGCRSQLRQIRATVAKPTPNSAASSRLDQCVTPSRRGGGVNVATTTCASSTRRGRPERFRSSSARSPPSA